MADKTFFISTPIYYPSDKLHIGHSYTTVAADMVARYHRMLGEDVLFLTGTDEHGLKIQQKAQEKGVSPKAFVDNICVSILELWKLLNISNNRFIRTTDEAHKACVQKIFQTLFDKGDIYKSEYEGLYCTPCESFWTESQLVEGKCPDCGREVQKAKEESYFFKLSKYQDRLIQLFEENPEFLEPKTRVNEMLNNFLRPGLSDLCVSRTTFSWGIPVPFDPSHVVYVWIDALSNYISTLGYLSEDDSLFQKYWPANVHLVGKEIVRFHSIIWPALLMALDLPLPKKIFGHGWLLLDGGKMSKSKGNVVDPVVLCERYSVDAIRYFLLREVPFGSDGVFSNEILFSRMNSDLANDLGNLLSRTIAMNEKYFGGTVQKSGAAEAIDEELYALAAEVKAAYFKNMDAMLLPNALSEVFRLIARANKYIDETAPWILAKSEESQPRLAAVLYNLLEVLRQAAILLLPAMPDTAAEIFLQLGVAASAQGFDSIEGFGVFDTFTTTKGKVLFPRIDTQAELAALEALTAPVKEEAAKEEASKLPEITFDDFSKVALRCAKILSCEPVEKSDKLLRMQADFGGMTKQIVSGIAKWYSPADLIGKKVAVVANLKPAKLFGQLSEAMILAADGKDGVVSVLFLDDSIPEGAEIR